MGKLLHGKRYTIEYKVWGNMRNRCLNPNNKDFKYYGGRGLTVCERWDQFTNFLEDMGKRPGKNYSIERIDNKKGYGPTNCRWATISEQNRNKRNIYYVKTKKRFLSFADVFCGSTLEKYPKGPANLILFKKMKQANLLYKCNDRGDLCLV